MEDEALREKIKKEAEKHANNFIEKIKKFLSSENPSDVLIIKAHLLCEYYFDQMLILKELTSANDLKKLTFFHKVKKISENDSSMKSDEQFRKAINLCYGLNKLRNKVGHELDFVLAESDVDGLGYIIGKSYILKKHDFKSLEHNLLDILQNIVTEVNILCSSLIFTEKFKKD